MSTILDVASHTPNKQVFAIIAENPRTPTLNSRALLIIVHLGQPSAQHDVADVRTNNLLFIIIEDDGQ